MSEQLQSKMTEILSAMQGAARTGGDFAMQQLPDIAQSYVIYGRIIHTSGFLAGFAILATLAFFSKKMVAALAKYDAWPLPVFFLGLPIGSILGAVSFSNMVMVWFAPKVWLIKEIAGMLK